MSQAESLPEALPAQWVEKIWGAMRAEYGASFDRQWECPAGEDPVRHVQSLKAHWARTLAGLFRRPDTIRYALDNLPPHPPNLPEFRALCNRAPEPNVKMLPAPKADPAKVAEALAPLRKFSRTEHGPKAWAWRLKAREEQGDKLGFYQRHAWRDALRAELQEEPAA